MWNPRAGGFALWVTLVACQAAPRLALPEAARATTPTHVAQASASQGERTSAPRLQREPEANRAARGEMSPAPCRFSVERGQLREVAVSVAEITFSVNVDGVPLQLQFRAGESRARVDVIDPLRFTGSYAVDELALRMASKVDLHDGRIRLGQGSAPERLGIHGDVLLVSIEKMLGVATKTPFGVPCRRLGLSDGSPYRAPSAVAPAPGREAVGVGREFIPLYPDAREGDALWMSYPGPLLVEERRPGWVLLNAEWSDGSRLRGWTRDRYTTAHFEPASEGWGEGGLVHGAGCGSSHPPLRSPVTIASGSPIAASPNGPVWAHVTREIQAEAYSFSFERSDGWIQLAAVPGLSADSCDPHEHLWLQRRHLLHGL